jgi:hypothetical protein
MMIKRNDMTDAGSGEKSSEDENNHRDLKGLDELFFRSKSIRISAQFYEFMDFISRFRTYAPYNNMLVFVQNPKTTFYATERDWLLKFGRKVKKYSRPMLILAPFHPVMPVYELEDTEGPDLPSFIIDPFELSGEFDERIFNRTAANLQKDGISVLSAPFSRLQGGVATRYVYRGRTPRGTHVVKLTITINDSLSKKDAYGVLCHEIAHIYLGHLGSDEDHWWPDRQRLTVDQKELEAESTNYLVCSRAGLLAKSDQYLSLYLKNEDDLREISPDLIVKTAGYVEALGKDKQKSKGEPRL